MLNNYQKFTIMANRDGQRQITVRADGGNTGSWGNSTGGMTGGMFSTSAVASAIGKPINIGIR